MAQDTHEYRQVIYRLLPGSRAKARKLAATAGACRFVWNAMLDQQEQLVVAARLAGADRLPGVSFFTQLRRVTPWLQEMPFAPVRYALKYQADAWQAFFSGRAGRPRFKRRGDDSVTLPDDIRIRNGMLYVPKIGPMRLRRRGGNSHPEGEPVQAVIKQRCGTWYATVGYRVTAVERPDDGTVTGLDMNAGQVADSNGHIHHAPDTRRLAMSRRNWQHHVSRALAGGTVVIEDLNTKAMTRSAKGMVEHPGTNVKAKAGLNREILATG